MQKPEIHKFADLHRNSSCKLVVDKIECLEIVQGAKLMWYLTLKQILEEQDCVKVPQGAKLPWYLPLEIVEFESNVLKMAAI